MNINNFDVCCEHRLCNSLVGYWKMEEASTMLNSLSGGVSLTTSGSINAQQTGKSNYGVTFSDVYNGILTCDGTVYGGKYIYDAFTISFWAKLDILPSVAGHSSHILYLVSSQGSGNAPVGLYISGTDNRLYFSLTTLSNINDYTYSSILSDITNFNHYCVVCNGIGGSIKIYINGEDDTARADTLTSYLRQLDSTIRIGNTNTGLGVSFNGTIDELSIYRRALSIDEITELYNSGTGKFYPFI